MHIYFSGIGGTGIGPLALICKQAGHEVSGSDMMHSQYTDYLQKQGINLHIGQTEDQILQVHKNKMIDWVVFSSAVFVHNPKHPELLFAQKYNIKISKRDECLNMIIKENDLKLIGVSGTHGKTTATAMLVWLFKKMEIPISYSVGAKLSFGPMGHFEKESKYFAYECDEFDKNFLKFTPYVSIITSIDWDHHEIYPSRQDYKNAFIQFINQSNLVYLFDKDLSYLHIKKNQAIKELKTSDATLDLIKLAGLHNRQNAFLCIKAVSELLELNEDETIKVVNSFPGANRRFERIANNIYSDYGHTPEEIEATLQMAGEIQKDFIVVYEPLTDRRQHYMKDQYKNVFNNAQKVYWLPSYLAREDPNTTILKPSELIKYLSPRTNAVEAQKNKSLKEEILKAASNNIMVICIAGGGGGSLDEWVRKEFN